VRRLGRIVLNAPTILSLLVCLASAALWVRGHWRMDYMDFVGPAGTLG
jgi:hypothetical protein